MSEEFHIALRTLNTAVFEVMSQRIVRCKTAFGSRCEPKITMSDGAMIEEVEGIEPLFHQVRVSADIGRMNARALIGIAGLWGNITVRCDARNALMFPSFFVVATCSEGVLSAGIGRDTCPLECAEALSKAFSKIGLPLIETCQTSEDTAILGSHAVGAWTTMRFDCFDPVLIALH